jgi:hypothetical protein
VITDGNGIPLAVSLGGGNRNDILQLMPLVEAIPPVRGKVGKPRRRPKRCMPTAPTITTVTAVSCGTRELS